MEFEPGQTLSHYRFVEKIGQGGMGVVWKAEDTKLGRQVAIKLLPAEVTSDPDRLARFEREAQLLASLNHPNIAAIYGIEEADGVRGLVLELVEGVDLARRLSQGPLSVEETLEVAKQIAGGLEAAHEQGIVHRDLKPANIQLTPDGSVKILDFGLAKATGPAHSGTDLSMSPTLTVAATQAGVIMGTAAYMSPEQARGQAADRRADIWAFGCVLYELLTGARPFAGATVSDILAAVLRAEPELDLLPSGTPPRLRSLLERCLRKDPRRRLRDIGDVRIELEEITEDPGGSTDAGAAPASTAMPARSRRTFGLASGLPWGLAVLMGAALLVVSLLPRGDGSTEPSQRRLLIHTGDGVILPQSNQPVLAISPDGKRVAIVGERDGARGILIREMDQFEARWLAGAEGGIAPFFSPDGQSVGFFVDDRLKRVPVSGGTALPVANVSRVHRGAHWGADNRIVFAPSATTGIFEVPATGGEALEVTRLDGDAGERTHRFPQIVPGGQWIILTVGTLDSPEYYDDARIDAVSLETGERHSVLDGASMARALASGHLVYARGGMLFAVPFDLETARVSGPAVLVVEGTRAFKQSGAAHFDVSLNGTLIYLPGRAANRLSHLVWVDRQGNLERITETPEARTQVALAPDGRHVAVVRAGESTNEIWVRDLESATETRVTFDASVFGPSWSPDSKRIAFGATEGGKSSAVYVVPRDGGTEKELLWSEDQGLTPTGWTPDGKQLLVTRARITDGNARQEIWVLPVDEPREPIPFLKREETDQTGRVSPDGSWIAHSSRQTGVLEIYVRAFPGSGGRWQISTEGGRDPQWSADGKELFFRNGNQTLAVAIDTSAGFRAGRPEVLFERNLLGTIEFTYSPSPDGERFLAIETAGDGGRPDVAVVLGWFEELRRRVPPAGTP